MKRWATIAAEWLAAVSPAAWLAYLLLRAETPRPWVLFLFTIAVVTVPLLVLGLRRRVFPSRPLFLIGLVPALGSLGLLASESLLVPLLVLDAIVVGLAATDLIMLFTLRTPLAERQAVRIASLRKSHHVTLTITNPTRQRLLVTLRDGLPTELVAQPAEFTFELPPRGRATLGYELRAQRRGAFVISAVFFRIRSRWGLWVRFPRTDVETTIHVYPDLKQLEQYALLARMDRLNLLGVRRARRVGQDNEFERLRDYTPDDSYKHIDWRTTARRRKLTVKDFQQNQSQRVLFLADCGRMMTNEAAGLSLLDHALNAALMAAYVALSRGDSVGLLCFSDDIHAFVPPQSGMRQMNRLLHGAFDRFPRLVESRYDRAFRYLASHVRKRSLVVLITNLIDEVNAHQLERYLANLSGKHLPLGVLLRDRRVFEFADAPEPQGVALYRAAAAAEILNWRHQVLADLHAKGVLLIDTFPEQLTAPLVNRYLEIKARHLL